MSDTLFVDFSQPAVNAAWLNTVNKAIYQVFGFVDAGPVTAAQFYLNLDLTTNAILLDVTSPAKGAGKIGFNYSLAYGVGTLGRWLKDLALGTGATFVGYVLAATGAVARYVSDKLSERVSAFDFMTAAQIADVQAGTLTQDVTAALQAFIDACSASNQYGCKKGWLPAGRYKITAGLQFKQQFAHIQGDGMWASEINFNGTAITALSSVAQTYFRPFLNDFAVRGNAGTGKALDLSAVSIEVYLGELKNLYLESGDDCFYAPRIFSTKLENVAAYSYAGHSFRAACGPAVSWVGCYALSAGPGKAGYRLAGTINMLACNGLNSGDYWGVFGNDTTSADGFQGDFAGNDYPDINLIGCNVEHFGSLSVNGEGVRVQNNYRRFNFDGGKIDRSDLATAYQSYFHFRRGSNGGAQPAVLAPAHLFLSPGTASLAVLYTDTGAFISDANGVFTAQGVTTYRNAGDGVLYPLLTSQATNDVYGDIAQTFSAITPRRLSVQMVRYKTPAALTPVGANQTIDVTGYTKVLVTPAAAASINKATFTATIGAGLDYARNGDLLIEATNANLTIVHSASGVDTFRMSAGANLVMAAGQVVRFARSETSAQWVQV